MKPITYKNNIGDSYFKHYFYKNIKIIFLWKILLKKIKKIKYNAKLVLKYDFKVDDLTQTTNVLKT